MKDIERKESRCSFCRLVWQTISPNATTQALRHKEVDLWLDNFAITSNGKIILRNYQVRQGPAIIQLEVSTREGTATWACFSIFTIHVLPQSPVANPKDNEFWRLLKWLDSCEECQHNVPLNEEESSRVNIHEKLQLYSKVIDVHRRRIVKAPKGCRYLALSYVWGGMNLSLLTRRSEALFEQEGSIELGQFPKTICDAIELCRELGERYLWIDSMCITQDSEDKHNQLKGMEAIYRGAVLTIVAAAGDHADVGLPGFSAEKFRFRQGLKVIQGLTLANMSPSFEQSVDLSHWNTRAWTYQERLLSRRLVIFTKDQLYFQCDHGRAQADSGLNPHDPTHVRYLNSGDATRNEAYRIELREKVNINVYAQMVKEYSSRQLSFVSDIENAFGGI
ncbi:HET-domain-containing protein, partial [Hyaloscypha bicolor E]